MRLARAEFLRVRSRTYRYSGEPSLRAPPFFPGITDVMVSPRKGENMTPQVLRTDLRLIYKWVVDQTFEKPY